MAKFAQEDLTGKTLEIAKRMLGSYLVSRIDGQTTRGRIVEVEAYHGDIDQACHCYYRRTERNEVMFWEPGHCYVYLIYGVHYCINVVTERRDTGAAVLIRALEPTHGLQTMRTRRGVRSDRDLTNGPAKLCQALAITKSLSGEHFLKSKWIALEKGAPLNRSAIGVSTRIGISRSRELPWRFFVKGSPWISKNI